MVKYKQEMKKFIEFEIDGVKVPTYQRRLVWSKKQKSEFIESIRMGFPFGSLLLYQYKEDNTYSIIDGLQRYSTLLDYQKNRGTYFDFSKYSDEILEKVEMRYQSEDRTKIQKQIEESIIKFFKEHSDNKGPKIYKLAECVINDTSILETTDMDYIFEIFENMMIEMKTEIDLENLDLPCITYLGSEDQLAEVFQRLNSGGKSLTKYQVFAAQWHSFDVVLNDEKFNTQILKIIKDRYERLNESRSIEIADFETEEFMTEKKINLSELCYAIGEVVIENSPVFLQNQKNDDKSEDLANMIGYSLMAIVCEIKNSQMSQIPSRRDYITAEKIEEIIINLTDFAKKINDKFEPLLGVPTKDGVKYQTEFINFQFLSFFASLWNNKFEKSSDLTLKVKSNSKNMEKHLLNNFKYHYIHDLFRNYWGGSGDSKIDHIYIEGEDRYIKTIDSIQMENALIEYWGDEYTKVNERVPKMTKLTWTIFYNSQKYETFERGTNYDWEHIIPLKVIKELKHRNYKICGGHLGNICLLSEHDNRGKKDKTVYQKMAPSEITTHVKSRLDCLRYPTEQELKIMDDEIDKLFHEKCLKLIEARYKATITEFIRLLYNEEN